MLDQNTRSINFEQVSAADFLEHGKRTGVVESRCTKLLAPFLERQADVESIVHRSFLDAGSMKAYLLHYNTKWNYLNGKAGLHVES